MSINTTFLSQLIIGGITSAINGIFMLIAVRYFNKVLEKIEKNGKRKCDK